MIKTIILDVDGVIVGYKPGINFPLPNQNVIQKLNHIHTQGIPVILCTAKFHHAITDIIKQANLNNPHITDGGALIINPLENKIIKKYTIDKSTVKELTKESLEKNLYLELYTPDFYYLQKNQKSDFTQKRTKLLQKEPTLTDSLFTLAENQDIIKMIIFTRNDQDIPKINQLVDKFSQHITATKSSHPYLTPATPYIITAPNISKAHAAEETIKNLNLSFNNTLGIGDTVSDWNFIKLCKYAATLQNGDKEIKKLMETKGSGNYFIAPDIDNNGIFDILKFFHLP